MYRWSFYMHTSLSIILAALWLYYYRDIPQRHPGITGIELDRILSGKGNNTIIIVSEYVVHRTGDSESHTDSWLHTNTMACYLLIRWSTVYCYCIQSTLRCHYYGSWKRINNKTACSCVCTHRGLSTSCHTQVISMRTSHSRIVSVLHWTVRCHFYCTHSLRVYAPCLLCVCELKVKLDVRWMQFIRVICPHVPGTRIFCIVSYVGASVFVCIAIVCMLVDFEYTRRILVGCWLMIALALGTW